MHKLFFHDPRSTPCGRKVKEGKRRKREKITLLPAVIAAESKAAFSFTRDFPDCKAASAEELVSCRNVLRSGYYHLQELLQIISTSEHIPTTDKFFCTGCLTIREVPDKGKGSFALSCYNCRKQVAESWAEFLTVLAAMSVYIVGECHPLEVDGPARLTDSPESLRSWLDDLSMPRDGVTNEASVKCSRVPYAAYHYYSFDSIVVSN